MLRAPLFAIVAALAALAVAPSAHAAANCRTAGHTVAANRAARVFSYNPNRTSRVIYACLLGREPEYYGELDGAVGITDLQLVGFHLGFVVHGIGCGRGECEPDRVWVFDLRRPLGPPAAAIATSYVLGRGGVYAALTQPDATGAIRVITVAADDMTTVIARGAVTPGSLALGAGRTFYWTQDGAPRSAQLPG